MSPATVTHSPLAPPDHDERFHKWAGFCLVLLLAVVPRVWAVLHTEVIQRDGVTFIRYARMLLNDTRGAIAEFDQHAGYPALVALVHTAVAPLYGDPDGIGPWELSGQLVSLVFGVIATMGVWAWVGLSVNWRVAWVASGLFALGRKWAMLGADVMSDATALGLWVWAVVLAILVARRIRDRGGWWGVVLLAAGTGVLAGGAYLVRPEGLGAVGVAALLWLGASVWRSAAPLGARFGRGATAVAVCGLATLAVAGPYMWEIGGVTKKKRVADLVPVAVAMPAEAVPFAQISPRGPAKELTTPLAVVAQTVEAMNPVVFGLAAAWVVMGGIHFAVPPRMRLGFLPFPRGVGAAAMVVTVGIYLPLVTRLHLTAGYLDWRHCMTLAFALVPLAGSGLVALTDYFSTLASPLRLKSLTVSQFVWCQWVWVYPVAAVGVGWQSFQPLHAQNSYVIAAGELIRREVAASPRGFVVTNLPWILHYAQTPGKVLDTSRLGNAACLARLEALRPRPTHLALSERWLREPDTPLHMLLSPPRFELLAKFSQKQGNDVLRVYRVHWTCDLAEPDTTTEVP